MLETSFKVGLQPEGAHYHSETVIKFVSFETEKRQQQSFGVVAKFESQWLFVFYFPEILLVMLN